MYGDIHLASKVMRLNEQKPDLRMNPETLQGSICKRAWEGMAVAVKGELRKVTTQKPSEEGFFCV